MTTHIVMEWERALLYRKGRLERVLGPGRHRFSGAFTKLITVDTRPTETVVSGQELLTADGVSVRVTVDVHWRVSDPVAYQNGAQVPSRVIYSAAQEAIRARMVAVTLEAALADRGAMSDGLDAAVADAVSTIGVTVDAVRVRDVMLPGELRKAAMDVVVARQRGKAALEAARAESAALRSLKNTAELLEKHPDLLRLRTLQVAAESGASVALDVRSRGRDD